MNLPVAPKQAVTPTGLITGEEARAYAKELSESTMLSPFFRGSVPNVLYAMALGNLYGLEAAAVLQNIHVFETSKDGEKTLKAGLSANLMVTLARRAGHLVTSKATASKATTTIVRGDTIFAKLLKGNIDKEELEHYSTILSTLKDMDLDPAKFAVTEASWNEEKAVTAGLFGKGNWAKYPHAMLAARAKTDAVRLACEEVLIQIGDNASRIAMEHGPLSTADGRPIDVSWQHTADELEAPMTDDGELITDAETHTKAPAPAREQVTVTRPRQSATPDARSAAADIAAQAASDPSKAGWGKPQEPVQEAPKKPSMADNVRAFVEKNPIEKITGITATTLTGGDFSAEERTERLLMIAVPAAETLAPAHLYTLLKTVIEHKADFAEGFLRALADYTPASVLAETIQEITRDEEVPTNERLGSVLVIHNRLKENERLDDPAPFHDLADKKDHDTSLGGAIKILMQPFIPQSGS